MTTKHMHMVFEKSSAAAVRGVARWALSPRQVTRSDWMPDP